MPRIVACEHCCTLTKMLDVPKGTPMKQARLEWVGGEEVVLKDEDGHPKMVPAYDVLLEDFVEKHSHGYDDNAVMGGLIKVWVVDQKTWDSMDVVTKIQDEMKKTTGKWYEDRDTYREGAIECYNAHGNPDIHSKCSDFMADSKRIGEKLWRDDSGNVHEIPQKYRQYLCYQCPYMHSAIATEVRWKKGLYK